MSQKMTKPDDRDFIHGFPREIWEEVSDNPELTEEDFKLRDRSARCFRNSPRRSSAGGGRIRQPKKQVTLRLDAEVVARYKAGGKGWQSRMNADLRKALGL